MNRYTEYGNAWKPENNPSKETLNSEQTLYYDKLNIIYTNIDSL